LGIAVIAVFFISALGMSNATAYTLYAPICALGSADISDSLTAPVYMDYFGNTENSRCFFGGYARAPDEPCQVLTPVSQHKFIIDLRDSQMLARNIIAEQGVVSTGINYTEEECGAINTPLSGALIHLAYSDQIGSNFGRYSAGNV
jgi:hypothetical protein